jgi:uncharacterized protein YutE (UPF0331/DUF86 family)/predicted nucleotidyltransferase
MNRKIFMVSKLQLLPEDIIKRLDQLTGKVETLDGLVALWLFGSFARNEATPISDVDLAYLPGENLQDDAIESFEIRLYNIIANVLHTDEFTFVNLNCVPVYLAFQVIKEGKLLLCRDRNIVSILTESVYRQSPDISYLRHKSNLDFLEGFDMSQPTIDKDRVTEFLRLISADLKDLRDKSRLSREAYLSSRDLQAIVERRLQTAIESCINIGNHLIARSSLRPPQDYGDVFRVLGEYQILPLSLAEQMIDMARFRNLLVHIYWEIDHQKVFNNLPDRLGALEAFILSIAKWLKSKN